MSHLTLEEAGAQYELRRIDLANGEQRTEAYLKINANGRVPALILDDGPVLTENIGILTYVGRLHPAARLIPTVRHAVIQRCRGVGAANCRWAS